MPDDTCTDGQVLQFRAVRWDHDGRQNSELPPLTGDRASAATAINDAGRVAGISGLCDQAVGRLTARSAVVWDQGRPWRLTDLGGVAWNTPMSVNKRGDIVGFLNRDAADGAKFRPVAAWWTAAGDLHRLDVPDGYAFGQALGINSHRQIVGAFSSDFLRCTAVLWEDDQLEVLQDVTQLAGVDLCAANDIKERGRITGQGVDRSTGATVAFRAEPIRG